MATDTEIMQAGSLIGSSFRQLGSDMLGLRDRADKKQKEIAAAKSAEILGSKFGETALGKTELGQVASLGIKNQSMEFGDALTKLTSIDPNKYMGMLVSDLNTIKDPEQMKAVNSMMNSLNDFNYAQYYMKEKAKAVWRDYGKSGGGGGSGDGSGKQGKGGYPKPVDLQGYDAMVRSETKLDENGNPSGLLELTLPNGKVAQVSIDDPVDVAIMKLSKEKESTGGIRGFLGGSVEKYTNEDLVGFKDSILNRKKEKAVVFLQRLNPALYSNPANASILDRDSERIKFNDAYMGTMNATSIIGKDGTIKGYKKMGFDKVPEMALSNLNYASGVSEDIAYASHESVIKFIKAKGVPENLVRELEKNPVKAKRAAQTLMEDTGTKAPTEAPRDSGKRSSQEISAEIAALEKDMKKVLIPQWKKKENKDRLASLREELLRNYDMTGSGNY